jgi:hypothetical protein
MIHSGKTECQQTVTAEAQSTLRWRRESRGRGRANKSQVAAPAVISILSFATTLQFTDISLDVILREASDFSGRI